MIFVEPAFYGDLELTNPTPDLVVAALVGLAAPGWTALVCRRRGVVLVDAVAVVFFSAIATLALFVFGPLFLWLASCDLRNVRCT